MPSQHPPSFLILLVAVGLAACGTITYEGGMTCKLDRPFLYNLSYVAYGDGNETVLFTQDLSLACSGFPVDLVINSSRVQVQKYVQIRVDHNCHTKSEDQILRTATDASVQGVEFIWYSYRIIKYDLTDKGEPIPYTRKCSGTNFVHKLLQN